MSDSHRLNQGNKVLANCGKCGLCLSVCPVYQTLKEEQASPRARLQLIKAHEHNSLESSPLLKEIISKCLMCGACAVTCPSGINHYERFMAMRQKMVEELGETPAIRGLIYLLSKEYRLRAGAGMGRIGQRLTPKFLADKYRLGNIPVSRFPKLNHRPFRESVPEKLPPSTGRESRGRILYFTGCATNYMFEDTGQAVTGILTRLGYEVVIPKSQTCCAIPLLYHGAADRAAANIRTNIEAFSDLDCHHIIVDCTTCGAALKDEYPAFLARQSRQDPALAAKAEEIALKTKDILSFLSGHDLNLDNEAPGLGRAVYHAPCHSRNSFSTHEMVRDLLTRLPNLEYIPTPEEDQCCGGGGTFFYEHPDVAGQMMEKKMTQITGTRADLWLTDCPVCRINLAGSQERVAVCHPAVPIFSAMKKDAQ
ncbi:MAG: (Fe-S)-binding protein [Desulfobacter sp.]|nr:MAG: (Fe-S)-binding protein [Desulfobacter sp.]